MNQPGVHPNESAGFNFHQQNVNPRQNDFHGSVTNYSVRPPPPPPPTDYGCSVVRFDCPQGQAAMNSELPECKTDFKAYQNFPKQLTTYDGAVTKSAGDQFVGGDMPASIPSSGVTRTGEIEQLKWQAGQGPSVELRLLVPGKNAGSIIGKSGANMKRLRSAFGVHVTLTDATTPDRILTFSGDLGAVCATLLEAISSIERIADKTQDCNIRMLIREGHTGYIIGKSGARIKELRMNTGAKIFIFPENCPWSNERVVQVMGKFVNVVNTVGTLIEHIIPVRCSDSLQLYDPCNFDDSFASEYGGYTTAELRGLPMQMPASMAFQGPHDSSASFSENVETYRGGRVPRMDSAGVHMSRQQPPGQIVHDQQPSGPSGLQSVHISVPKHLVSTVLGHRCMALKDLRNESKAQIHALVPPAGAMERLLTIEGTVEQIQKAQYLIQKRYIHAMCPRAAWPVEAIDPNAVPPPRPTRERLRPGAPWFNDEIKKAKLLRRKLERNWRAKKSEESQQAFRDQSYKLNQLIRTAKEQYYAIHGGGPEYLRKSDSDKMQDDDDDVDSDDSLHDTSSMQEEDSIN